MNNASITRSQMFFCKLIPRRATFPGDITPDEAAIMKQHADYWAQFMARGKVLAFGPVSDPAGAYGAGILNATETEIQDFLARDPSITGGLNRAEFYPMTVVHPAHPD